MMHPFIPDISDSYKTEQQNRSLEKARKAAENGDNNINELIKVN